MGAKKPEEYPYIPAQKGEETGPVVSLPETHPTAKIQDYVEVSDGKPLSAEQPLLASAPKIYKPGTASEAALRASKNKMATNPWLTQSSMLGCLMKLLSEIVELQEAIRYNETILDRDIRESHWETAVENAKLSETLRLKESQEHLFQAYSHLSNAAITTGQALSVGTQTGEAEKEYKAETEKLKTEQNRLLGVDAVIVNDTSPPNAAARRAAQVADLKATKPDDYQRYKNLEDTIQKREFAQAENVHRMSEQKIQLAGHKAEIFKNAMSGFTSLQTASLKKDSASLQKAKEINEGYIRAADKYSEGAKQARDDAKNQIKEFCDLMSRIVADTIKAHLLGHA